MKNNNELGIYIHIPFCMQKCIYCDFLSSPQKDEVKGKYVQAIINEINNTETGREDNVTSIFIGGGTPSFIAADYIKDILDAIKKNYKVSKDAEITIECNPGTMDEKKAYIYKACGINRISFGLQSTDDKELKMLGRIHTFSDFMESYELARKQGFNNINIDIMSALPGQTVTQFENVLKTAIKLNTEHISAYSLIIEEGTKLYNDIDKYPDIPSEKEDRIMYDMTARFFKAAGLNQYEISNYAKEGYECKHNIKYWERCNYLGFGIGAASLYGNKRYTNMSNLKEYIKLMTDSEFKDLSVIRSDEEILTVEDEMSEYMFLGLRKTKGINVEHFKESFGCDINNIFGDVIQNNIKNKLLAVEGSSLYLTRRGIDISNTVMSDFLLD